MQYRKLKGDKIFDGFQLLEDKVLVVQENGIIEAIIDGERAGEDIEVLQGVLTPGFINCHCHLELSGMKGLIPESTGLVAFLIKVVTNRTEILNKEKAIAEAAKELEKNGVAGVADICNTTDAINAKLTSHMRWKNLVEVISFYDRTLPERLATYTAVASNYEQQGLHAVLTPHAPYSVSKATFEAINERTANQVISIHNQETPGENELFQKGSGDFLKLYTQFFDGRSPLEVSKKSSLQTWLPYFTNGQTIILVHNTFTSEEDILAAQKHAEKYELQLVYCLCPNANLYIENAVPPVDLFIKHHCKIVVGTDSYSSNHQLNIASELKTLQQHFPHLSLQTLLQWATANGADALGWADLGRLERGTKPGVNLLDEKTFAVQKVL